MILRIGKAAGGPMAVCAVLLGLAPSATAIDLTPHRALYDITLASVHGSSDITGLDGRMMLEWADACDGWTVNQQVRMRFTPREGPPLLNEFNFSSFESKDGNVFRFTMRSSTDGRPYEEYVGKAKRHKGAGGLVTFTIPDGQTVDLPKGVMFPSEHLFDLVAHAVAGDRYMGRVVFSGTGPASLHEVTAFIGPEIPVGSKPVGEPGADDAAIGSLTDLRSWWVAMGYFPLSAHESQPEFEVSYRLMENGVAGDLTMDYGEFAMHAGLAKLEFLKPPDC